MQTHLIRPLLSALALTAVLGLVFLGAGGHPPAGPAHVDFEVDVAPLPETPDAYSCQATIRDPESGTVLASPRVVFPRGEAARTETRIPDSDRVATLSVHVSDDGVLTYEAAVRAGDTVVSRHRATVALDG